MAAFYQQNDVTIFLLHIPGFQYLNNDYSTGQCYNYSATCCVITNNNGSPRYIHNVTSGVINDDTYGTGQCYSYNVRYLGVVNNNDYSTGQCYSHSVTCYVIKDNNCSSVYCYCHSITWGVINDNDCSDCGTVHQILITHHTRHQHHCCRYYSLSKIRKGKQHIFLRVTIGQTTFLRVVIGGLAVLFTLSYFGRTICLIAASVI